MGKVRAQHFDDGRRLPVVIRHSIRFAAGVLLFVTSAAFATQFAAAPAGAALCGSAAVATGTPHVATAVPSRHGSIVGDDLDAGVFFPPGMTASDETSETSCEPDSFASPHPGDQQPDDDTYAAAGPSFEGGNGSLTYRWKAQHLP